ncbi:MAG TPA: choice-of-anchor tandem repeat GloVer-containing protein [Terriglobales bacterium]|nr:choice-of-anchor tandem repeat GloVer-containing protein [Terriglobales bacterium]
MRYVTLQSKLVASLFSLLSFPFFPALAAAHSVNLSWDASTSQQVIGYNVYRGANPGGPYTQINSILDPNTSYTDGTVQSGQTYYYVTTAVNSDNTQSEYSNQAEAVIPGGGSGSENALYNFAGGSDPKLPYAGLVFDKAGNLYGTTELGGTDNQGTVFEISRNANGTWTETVLYNFTGSSDGGQPYGSLVFDAAGNLYGTTNFGGSANCNLGCGTVFKLTPGSGGWTETVLYTFTGGSDGREPYARLLFDATGNLYGTTLLGGNIGSVCSSGCGTVFKLTPGSSGWTESVLYAFQGTADGASPYDGLAFDAAGNLYGTANAGGASGYGVIFKLTPGSSEWTEGVLHAFKGENDGKYSYGDLILDAAGNLYGTAYQGGGAGYGVVFELQPNSQGRWTEKVLHAFVNTPAGNPVAGLVMDTAGNLYGTTMLGATQSSCGGGCGTLFKLALVSGGGWTYKVVHVFGHGTDGYHPTGDLILDSAGNVYGTTQAGGAQGSGMVFEIMH